MIGVFYCNAIDSNVHFHGIMTRFFRPKSLLVALIDVLIYVLHTHFDRGLKVRLSRHTAHAPFRVLRWILLCAQKICLSEDSMPTGMTTLLSSTQHDDSVMLCLSKSQVKNIAKDSYCDYLHHLLCPESRQ
jgi:hypothetical protein